MSKYEQYALTDTIKNMIYVLKVPLYRLEGGIKFE